jgi:hypothetical protein
LPDLVIEPASRVDDREARVDARDLRQLLVGDGLDDENVDPRRLRA